MKKIKIAQIGVNQYSHSMEILGSISKQSDLFEVMGYTLPEGEKERIPQKHEKLGNYREMTLEEILNDPEIEAVTVETDEIHLTKYALMAAKAGKHIHMEKPGGGNLAEFEELIATMRQTGKVLHLGYMYRYNPYIIDLLERIEKGELGEILCVEAQMGCFHRREIRQWLQELPGGIMFYLGCHLIDLIFRIQGQPKEIIPLNTSTHVNTDAPDFGMVIMAYENGISYAKANAREYGGYARRQLVVTGTEGTIEIQPLEMFVPGKGIYTEKTEYMEKAWDHLGEHSKTELFDRYDAMMAGFADCVLGERKNPYTLDYELDLYKLLLQCCGGTEE